MASLQDLRGAIRSVRNTRKITKAMELVAGARLRRARARIEEMRPYADRMLELMVGTARAASLVAEPAAAAAARRGQRRSAIVVVTGDRGLAGAFNAQVLRHAFELERQARAEGQEVRWLVVGRRAPRRSASGATSSPASGPGSPTSRRTRDAQAIGHRLAELYAAEEVDRVVLVYNRSCRRSCSG